MLSICGLDCCRECDRRNDCSGCVETEGHPFGGMCIAAECIKQGGPDASLRLKNKLIDEFNSLGIQGLEVKDLNLLNGFYINLEYTFASGQTARLLEDRNIYWGNQIEIPGSGRCYGLAADNKYLLVCEYGGNGAEPEIVVYKRRKFLDMEEK